MDKKQILEAAFEVIKESTEWGIECKDSTYGHWIDGVVAVVDNLLDKIDEERNCRIREVMDMCNTGNTVENIKDFSVKSLNMDGMK